MQFTLNLGFTNDQPAFEDTLPTGHRIHIAIAGDFTIRLPFPIMSQYAVRLPVRRLSRGPQVPVRLSNSLGEMIETQPAKRIGSVETKGDVDERESPLVVDFTDGYHPRSLAPHFDQFS